MFSRYTEHQIPPEAPRPKAIHYRGLLGELAAGLDLVRLGLAGPSLLRQPRGRGQRVVLIPGWKAPEASMEPLRRYLRFLGYNARHWGLGVNRGQPEADRDALLPQLLSAHRATGQSTTLVGWSLGGVIARECARVAPELVPQVITCGTPVVGGPSYTIGAANWGEEECRAITKQLQQLDAEQPITVPLGVIYSRRDRVVSWPACLDHVSPRAVHYEVGATHLGMGVHPGVWRVVANRLTDQ